MYHELPVTFAKTLGFVGGQSTQGAKRLFCNLAKRWQVVLFAVMNLIVLQKTQFAAMDAFSRALGVNRRQGVSYKTCSRRNAYNRYFN